jgi:signal transduction histidine kinase
MTDLIDSLLEFARTRESLSPTNGTVLEVIQRSAHAVRLHPRHHARVIDVHCDPQLSAWFDPRKLERALYNLLLNACEAAPAHGGEVEITAQPTPRGICIEVADNGPGIADSIRDRLFHPFVSYGKENGTGLGLAVVQKIVQDHSGEISVERTGYGKTVFRIVLPSGGREIALKAESSPEVPVSVEHHQGGGTSISRPGP